MSPLPGLIAFAHIYISIDMSPLPGLTDKGVLNPVQNYEGFCLCKAM